MRWASYKIHKSKGQENREVACGDACWWCASTASKGFPCLSWTEVVNKCKSSSEFASLFGLAKERLKTLQASEPAASSQAPWLPESLSNISHQMVVLENDYWFLTVEDLERDFDLKGKSSLLGLQYEQIQDEGVATLKGIFIARDDCPYRKVKIQFQQGTELSRPRDMIRGNHHAETHAFLLAEEGKKRQKQWGAPISLKSLKDLIDDAKSKFVETVAQGDATQVPAPVASPCKRPAQDDLSWASRLTGSRVTKGGPSNQITVQKLMEQAERYTKKILDPLPALAGEAVKSPIYQAQRILTAMQETHSLVRGQLTLVEKCENLGLNFSALGKSQHETLLEEVSGSIDAWPFPFQKLLVLQTIKDMPLRKEVEAAEWVDIVAPICKSEKGHAFQSLSLNPCNAGSLIDCWPVCV